MALPAKAGDSARNSKDLAILPGLARRASSIWSIPIKRPVHDQAGITLAAGDIGLVVVDAMAVEGERREAEQQHRVGHDRRDQVASAGAALRPRLLAGLRGLAIDDVVLLDEREAARADDRVLARSRTPSTPVEPVLGSTDLMVETRLIVSPIRSGSPSKANRLPAHMRRGSGDRRQEVAALGMSVRADLRGSHGFEEVEPVPERRQRIAGPRIGVVLVEGRDQRAHRPRGGEIFDGLRLADPVAQHRRATWRPILRIAPQRRGGKAAPCCYNPPRQQDAERLK